MGVKYKKKKKYTRETWYIRGPIWPFSFFLAGLLSHVCPASNLKMEESFRSTVCGRFWTMLYSAAGSVAYILIWCSYGSNFYNNGNVYTRWAINVWCFKFLRAALYWMQYDLLNILTPFLMKSVEKWGSATQNTIFEMGVWGGHEKCFFANFDGF